MKILFAIDFMRTLLFWASGKQSIIEKSLKFQSTVVDTWYKSKNQYQLNYTYHIQIIRLLQRASIHVLNESINTLK